MNREPSVINIVCLVAKQVKELGIHDRHHKVKRSICIGNNNEQRCFFLA